MRDSLKTNVSDGKGGYIVLNAKEASVAHNLQQKYNSEVRNALGFEISITTLTAISKRITDQKFFTIRPSEYMPVRVGENSWSTNILTYLDYALGGDFEEGNLNVAGDNSRLAQTTAGISSITVPVINWAKQIVWNFMELQIAARSGNWDLVTSKEISRKKNWDLGIQEVAFFGSKNNTEVKGLLTQSGVNSNTAVIDQYLKDMTATEFQQFLAYILPAYRVNSNFTAYPTHFIIPELDYNGLASAVDETFNLKSRLQRIEESFQLLTRNPNFKVLPCAYADQANNSAISGLNKNRYVLLNYDETSLRMDIPVDYTNTLQNTINGFQFQNVGYGQYTGAMAYRKPELLYFDWAD